MGNEITKIKAKIEQIDNKMILLINQREQFRRDHEKIQVELTQLKNDLYQLSQMIEYEKQMIE